jgi:hypothetical protein
MAASQTVSPGASMRQPAGWSDSTGTALVRPDGSIVELSAAANASRLTRRPRRLFNGERFASFSYAALGSNTATGAADTANGVYAGGDVITMTQVTTGSGNKNIIDASGFACPVLGALNPWFATVEMKLDSSARFAALTLDNGVSSNFIYVSVGASNAFTLVEPGGTSTGAITPTGFDQTTWFRITVVCVPTGQLTGTLRLYVHFKSSVTATEKRAFIGSVPYSNGIVPTRMRVTQDWTAAGVLLVTKAYIYELSGILSGCSVDAGYVGWCPSPETGRTFSANAYNPNRNPARLLADAFNGSDEYILNHANGSFYVSDMLAGLSDWVLALNPTYHIIGSATNSVVLAQLDATPAAFLAAVKADYLSMAQQCRAAGIVTVAVGVAPRHDATVTGGAGGLAAFAALALDFNAWMASTLRPLGVGVVDPWATLVDPGTANQLVGWANCGDNVHFTWPAQRVISDLTFAALVSGY